MRSKQLILVAVLAVLIAIWGLTRFIDLRQERTFDPGFPTLNLSAIHTFKLYPASAKGSEIILYKANDAWRVIQGTKDFPVHRGRMDIIFTELDNLEASRLAGISKDIWDEMGVTDSLATRLVAETDQGVAIDLMIGRFQYREAAKELIGRPPPGTQDKRGITYVRLNGEEKVYSAEGFFGPNFDQEFGVWRNQQVLKVGEAELDSIRFDYPDNSVFTIAVRSDGWYWYDAQVREEAQMAYAATINNKIYTYFADGFKPERPPLFSAKYFLNTGEVVALDAYEANSGQIIVHSSQSPETYFLDHEDQLIDQLLPPLFYFVGEPGA